MCKTKVDLERISGSSDGGDCQFRLVLPYCSKKLKWEVLFDASAPWFAPDFRFDDDSFLSSIDEDFLDNMVPSLAKWNENNPKALSEVVAELVEVYKTHQVCIFLNIHKYNLVFSRSIFTDYLSISNKLLTFQVKKLNEDENSRAFFEYGALLGDALTSEQDIEVWVGAHVVEFLIRLNVDTSRLPELYNEG